MRERDTPPPLVGLGPDGALPGQRAIPGSGVPDVPPRPPVSPPPPLPAAPPSETPLDAARRHLARGFQPVPIKPRDKMPAAGNGWQLQRYTIEQLPVAFPLDGNIGLLLGAASGGLVDVDLDCREAIAVAPACLPPTGMRHGRASTSLESHHWYFVDAPPPKLTRYKDPTDGACIVELRSGSDKSGAQTVIPPSIHKDTGERIAWSADGEPARVTIEQLHGAVSGLAAAALLAKHFPAQGSRHDFALALAGMLLRDPSIGESGAYRLVELVARAGGSDNPSARAGAVRLTAAKLAAGEPVTGRPRLAEIIGDGGEKVVSAAAKWLGLDAPPEQARQRADGERPTDSADVCEDLHRSYACLLTLLRENRRDVLDGRTIRYDEMRRAPMLGDKELRDVDVSALKERIELRIKIPESGADGEKRAVSYCVSSGELHEALVQVAHEASYHPVRDYLDARKWDGVPRIALVPSVALRAEDTALNRALIRRWFISAIARPKQPGCKVDTVLVLVGAEGVGKSSAFRALTAPWFGDTAIDVHSKDAYATLQRAWVQEWSELESLRRARDADAVKSFLSSAADTYRPPYGRLDVTVPRTSIIVGTTNRGEFLVDETGARRFWPLTVGAIDLAWLGANRDELWAEAVAAFRAGEQWWLTAEEERLLAPRHDEHTVTDAWEDAVLAFAAAPQRDALDSMKCVRAVLPLTTPNVLQHALNKPTGQWTRADEMRVAAILTRAGYRKSGARSGGKSGARVWRKS